MQNLTLELNGTRYILVGRFVTAADAKKADKIIKKYECIIQDVKFIKGWFFYKSLLRVKILVPEKNIVAFNNEKDI